MMSNRDSANRLQAFAWWFAELPRDGGSPALGLELRVERVEHRRRQLLQVHAPDARDDVAIDGEPVIT
jgi:hypothetical protein